jgi:hypothetical protein
MIGTCQRCNKEREIYNISKQLCSSCRVLEALYNHPRRYARLKRKTREAYHKNPQDKINYNYKYYRTGDNAERMKAYGRNYWAKYKGVKKKDR